MFRITSFALVMISGILWMPSHINGQDLSANDVISKWLETNNGVSRLKLNFTQTQVMKTVKAPLVQRGTLWLDMGSNKFRWEAGKTLVTGNGSTITIQRTGSKKYEEREAGSGAPGMASLSKGFPKSLDDFNSKYKLLKVTKGASNYSILTQPLGSSGKGVKTFTFKVDAAKFNLEGISLVLKDGSRMSTNFNNIDRNPELPESLFTADLSGYTETKFGD